MNDKFQLSLFFSFCYQCTSYLEWVIYRTHFLQYTTIVLSCSEHDERQITQPVFADHL